MPKPGAALASPGREPAFPCGDHAFCSPTAHLFWRCLLFLGMTEQVLILTLGPQTDRGSWQLPELWEGQQGPPTPVPKTPVTCLASGEGHRVIHEGK